MTTRPPLRTLFLSHGGGPLPLLGDPAHREMVQSLEQIAKAHRRPGAIVVVSAHWEDKQFGVTHQPAPSLLYDYYGFPDESYQITYPAPGAPSIAEDIYHHLQAAGLPASLQEERGFDHGLFIPLKIMYPEGDIPCVQVSLHASLDPAIHIRLGQCLAEATNDEVLIIGSGFSFHNMRAFFNHTQEPDTDNAAFEDWLVKTLSDDELQETECTERLLNWAEAPGARYCHPREEHLIPLHVCYGAQQQPSREHQRLHILHKQASMYWW